MYNNFYFILNIVFKFNIYHLVSDSFFNFQNYFRFLFLEIFNGNIILTVIFFD